jgi:hypothetical protein
VCGGALYADAYTLGNNKPKGETLGGIGDFNCGCWGIPASGRIAPIAGPVCLLLHSPCAELDSLCIRSLTRRRCHTVPARMA